MAKTFLLRSLLRSREYGKYTCHYFSLSKKFKKSNSVLSTFMATDILLIILINCGHFIFKRKSCINF